MKKFSIIIPAYNEEENVGRLIDSIKKCNFECEIIVVNDGSTDKTEEIARSNGAKIVRHPYNLGNGASIRSGIEVSSSEVLVFMDADMQHEPRDIPQLLMDIGEYDMVVGARAKGSYASGFRKIGNFILIKLAEYLTGKIILDLTSGFRAVKRDVALKFKYLFPQRYSYTTTLTLAMFMDGYFIKYIPLRTIKNRGGGTSKIRPFRDGFRFINIIMRMVMLFNPRKIFLPASLIFLVTGLIIAIADIINKNIQESTILIIIVGTFLFFFSFVADQIAHIQRQLSEIAHKK
jgi:glycosyltransferase involved in cell wall biosynthesis